MQEGERAEKTETTKHRFSGVHFQEFCIWIWNLGNKYTTDKWEKHNREKEQKRRERKKYANTKQLNQNAFNRILRCTANIIQKCAFSHWLLCVHDFFSEISAAAHVVFMRILFLTKIFLTLNVFSQSKNAEITKLEEIIGAYFLLADIVPRFHLYQLPRPQYM